MSKSISDAIVRNASDNAPFSSILEARLSRRTLTRGGLGAVFAAMAGGGLAACGGGDGGGDDKPDAGKLALGFASLPTSMTDGCVVPAGYAAHVLGAPSPPRRVAD